MKQFPVFIVCRDRLTCLLGLLDWLVSVGNADEVYLIDNDSAWPPLLDYYETTPHEVIRVGENAGHRVGWTHGYLKQFTHQRRFIYTDPDVLPVAECPTNAIAKMDEALSKYRNTVKVGFSIKIDDLPECAPPGAALWEEKYWRRHWHWDIKAYRAPIDTTFALYATHATAKFRYHPAFRLAPPYSVRHLPWYMDPHNLDEETAFYVSRAERKISNWSRDVDDMTRDHADVH